ncbi:hypothetical protein DSO57_1008129 [Entomophthora muscae]|uniref:Uncharacterized protein n=1 Tax=Entomophthora muscae TaxID=34485 RepID=A0ACC2SKK3_9FUNG|nr:hypothetical protein DSO57_1008129 [Entomophthora muscae]
MVYWKGTKLGNDWMLGVMAIAGILTKSNKNSQQPKRQASKGSKETASTPKRAKKPAKAKSSTPSLPTPSPPTPPPSTLIFYIPFTFPPKILPQ